VVGLGQAPRWLLSGGLRWRLFNSFYVIGSGGTAYFPAHTGQDLYSLTFTLNFKPTPSTKISPEIRYDHTSLNNGFDGDENRFMIGMGVSYMF
jgi:hypothetical protein